MVIATLNTAHFSFMAAGETKADALKALKKGWKAHAFEYRRFNNPIQPFSYYEDGVGYTNLKPGECARDFERIS
jgi:hypothetical protein